LIQVWQEIWIDSPWENEESSKVDDEKYLREFAFEGKGCVALDKDKEIIGLILGYKNRTKEIKHENEKRVVESLTKGSSFATIDELVVSPNYRNHGVGKTL